MTNLKLDSFHHVFFIGIGGISMSGLAEVLRKRGFTVAGSDQSSSKITRHLEELGITVYEGHAPDHIPDDTDLIIYTAAVKEDNPEYQEALRRGLPIIERAVLLGLIMGEYDKSIAVAGTHGKTTTTSMISYILLAADTDPTISVGAILKGIQGNFRVGQSETFITEACEYSNSYHHFYPYISIILNIEKDHVDFFESMDAIYDSFNRFAANTKKGGFLILNDAIDTSHLNLEDGFDVVTVGHESKSNYTYKDLRYNTLGLPSFTILEDNHELGDVQLSVPGIHNVENALAAVACSRKLGLSMDAIVQGLKTFTGADRRFEYKGTFNDVTIIDDYAHHPTEIEKTIEAAKRMDIHDLWVIFQPHTYTRTKALYPEFVAALSKADKLILTDIYAAREKDPGDIHPNMLVESLGNLGKDIVYIADFDEISKYVIKNCVPKDMLITMGAGTVTNIGDLILKGHLST